MHGRVHISRGSTVIATLTAEQGQAASLPHGLPIFGEGAMIDREPRSAAATATTDCKFLTLPLETWAAVTLAAPDFRTRLRRLRDLPSRVDVA